MKALLNSGRFFRIASTVIVFILLCPDAAPGEGEELLPSLRRPSAVKLERMRASLEATGLRQKGDAKPKGKTWSPLDEDDDGFGGGQKIVGGSNADPGEWPFMAALVESANPDNFLGQFCGGSLVHPYWVVTAAHCVFDINPADVDVVLGAHNLDTDVSVQRVAVEEIIIHPGYNDTALHNDIAMLRLAVPANAIYPTIPIIDDATLAAAGNVGTTIGWGNTNGGGTVYPEILQEVMLPIVSLGLANDPAAYDGSLTADMLPAGFAAGGFASCSGDSGGPMVVPSPVGDGWALAGIVSFGMGGVDCDAPNNYSIYTRVHSYRSFILGCIHPIYGRWESANSVEGRERNPDGDFFENFGDFSFLDDPVSSPSVDFLFPGTAVSGPMTFPTVSFARPENSGGIDYRLFYSTNLSGFAEYPFDANVLSQVPVPGNPGVEDVTVMVPEAIESNSTGRGFISVTAEPSGDYVIDLKDVDCPIFAKRQLSDDDEEYPAQPGRRVKTFRILSPPVGQALVVGLRSSEFDPVVEILNNDTGAVLFSASADNAGEEDEEIRFTPGAGIDYVVRVTSDSAGELGSFHLALYKVAEEILRTDTINSDLSGSDPFDPNFLPDQYYSEDYFLQPAADPRGMIVDLTSGAIDAHLTIINAENGTIVHSNDDFSGLDSRTTFVALARTPYIVRARTALQLQTGAFALQSTVGADIGLSDAITGELEGTDQTDPQSGPGYKIDDWAFTGGSPGQSVTVAMESVEFDTFLLLLDGETGAILDFNDDIDPEEGTNSELSFTVQAGKDYVIRAASFSATTGEYEVIVVSP